MTNDLVYNFEEQLLSDLHGAQLCATDVTAPVRHRRSRRRLIPLTGAGLAVSGGLTAVAVTLGTSSAPFAGWTPVASAATNTQVASADQGCRPELLLPGQMTEPEWQIVTSEDQGPYTLVVYASGEDTATCLSAPGMNLTVESFGKGIGGGVATASGHASRSSASANGRLTEMSDGIEHTTVDGQLATVIHAGSDQGTYTIVEGTVDSNVTGLAIARSNGATVETSVNNGWFAAWWPGSDDPTSAQVTTASGTTSTSISVPVAPQPATGTGNTGSVAGNSGAVADTSHSSTSTGGNSGS